MALAAVKTFIAGEVLFASDLNALNTNILTNPISLISPFTASVDAGGFDLTNLDELALANAAADATAAGRLRRNATNVTWHDGTAARHLMTNAYVTMTGNFGIVPAAVSGTPTQHALFRENVVKGWVTFNPGTATVLDSFNVASVANAGTGSIEVTWDRDFANANYAVAVSWQKAGDNSLSEYVTSNTVGVTTVKLCDSLPTGVNPDVWHVVAIGDQ